MVGFFWIFLMTCRARAIHNTTKIYGISGMIFYNRFFRLQLPRLRQPCPPWGWGRMRCLQVPVQELYVFFKQVIRHYRYRGAPAAGKESSHQRRFFPEEFRILQAEAPGASSNTKWFLQSKKENCVRVHDMKQILCVWVIIPSRKITIGRISSFF
jgi:hypothetical protein